MQTKNMAFKLRGREVMQGDYGRTSVIFAVFTAMLMLWGIFTQILRTLLDMQWISAALFAAWEKLPALTGLLCAVLLLLLALLTLSPLSLGCTAWFLGGAMRRRRSGKWFVFWLRFSHTLRAARLKLSLALRKSGVTALFLTPGSMLLGGCAYLLLHGGVERNVLQMLAATGLALLAVGGGFALLTLQRYFLAAYLLARTPTLTAAQAVHRSIALMQGGQGRLLLFRLSFLPWLLPCLLLFPLIYAWPYYRQSCAVWAYSRMAQGEEQNTNKKSV